MATVLSSGLLPICIRLQPPASDILGVRGQATARPVQNAQEQYLVCRHCSCYGVPYFLPVMAPDTGRGVHPSRIAQTGLEPVLSAYETDVLPLHYRAILFFRLPQAPAGWGFTIQTHTRTRSLVALAGGA